MWQTHPPCGFQPTGWPAMVNPRIPFTRPRRDDDPRINPVTGGGRRLRHPFLDDLIYPSNPNRTPGFDWYVLRKTRTVLTRTEGGTATANYREGLDDVLISEIWDAGSAPVDVEFYRLLRRYREEILPDGECIGWTPADLSPYHYAVELVDVKLGSSDIDEVEEHGDYEPYMLHQPLTLQFKMIQEARPPLGELILLGF